MTARRNEVEIFLKVLDAAKGGAIMACELKLKANLSSYRMQRYTRALIAKGLLVKINHESEKDQIYKLTEEGVKILTLFDKLERLTADVGASP